MAFPTIPTTGANTLLSSTTSPASTTHTFPSLTTLAPAAGDLIIAICVQYGAATAGNQFSSWGASLTEILDSSENATGTGALGVAYKSASGSESGTFTVTSAQAFKSVNFLMRIPTGTWNSGTAPEVQAATRAAAAVADPASFDPTNWGAEDTLWISVAGQTETSTTGNPPTLDSAPTNYSGALIVARVADAVGDITAGVAFRQLNASAEDVGTWTASNALRGNGIATVIAVRPSGDRTVSASGAPATSTGSASLVHVPIVLASHTIGASTAAVTAPKPLETVIQPISAATASVSTVTLLKVSNATVNATGAIASATASSVAALPTITVSAVASSTASVAAPVVGASETIVSVLASATASTLNPLPLLTVTSVATASASVTVPYIDSGLPPVNFANVLIFGN